MRTLRNDERWAHIVLLCDLHDIVQGSASRRGAAGRRLADGGLGINVPPIRGQVSYFVALHEIGHLIGKGRSKPRLESEANAWLWALDEALEEPTEATRRAIANRLQSYWRWAISRQYRKVPPRIPADDHPFWELAQLGDFA